MMRILFHSLLLLQTCFSRSKVLEMMVFDNCGGDCKDTQLNLHALAFLQLAPMPVGRIAVQYRQVSSQVALLAVRDEL